MVVPTAANLNFLHAQEIEDANGDTQLYAGGDDGMLYELFSDNSQNWVNAEGTVFAMDTKFTTPYMRLGDEARGVFGQSGRVHPRWVELRATTEQQTKWKVTVETADGSAQKVPRDSKEIEFEFGVNNALIREPTRDLHPGEYVRFTIQNNDLNVTSTIAALRVHYYVKPGQFQRTEVDNRTP